MELQDLHTDTALEFELQLDHVHLLVGAEFVQLSAPIPHLIYGHINGLQLQVLLPNHLYSLLHIRESVCRCGCVHTSQTQTLSSKKKEEEQKPRYAPGYT